MLYHNSEFSQFMAADMWALLQKVVGVDFELGEGSEDLIKIFGRTQVQDGNQ